MLLLLWNNISAKSMFGCVITLVFVCNLIITHLAAADSSRCSLYCQKQAASPLSSLLELQTVYLQISLDLSNLKTSQKYVYVHTLHAAPYLQYTEWRWTCGLGVCYPLCAAVVNNVHH